MTETPPPRRRPATRSLQASGGGPFAVTVTRGPCLMVVRPSRHQPIRPIDVSVESPSLGHFKGSTGTGGLPFTTSGYVGVSPLNELAVPLHKLLSYTLWSLTGLLLVAAWIVYFENYADLAIMLITTACLTALGGAVATAQAWALCVIRMLRLTGVGGVDPRVVRPVRKRIEDG